ncbi:MAG: chemotaxis protein CheW [Crocosphaera sp.]|nr:chemotaxis protein CheW [Crocosphaera sp.]
MKKDYFSIELSQSNFLALPLENMGTVLQIDPEKICLIPGILPELLGVINYQGSLLWVLDTDQFFNIESDFSSFQKSLTAIIMKSTIPGTRKKVALIVKKIQGVLSLTNQAKILSTHHNFAKYQYFLDSIVMNNNTIVGILDTDKILNSLQNKVD